MGGSGAHLGSPTGVANVSVAALFPGQGSAVVGMGEALHRENDAARAILDAAEAVLPGLQEVMWRGPAETLQQTAFQQPALVAVGAAAYAAYRAAGGPAPAFVAGHSLGEFTALVCAGSLTIGDAVRLVRIRGEAMQAAVPIGVGAMIALLKIGRAQAEAAVAAANAEGHAVDVANLNAPLQTVISGTAEGVAAAAAHAKAAGARAIPLKVSAPFHSRLMAPAADALAPHLDAVAMAPLAMPLIANVTADVVTDPEVERRLLLAQVTASVRWVETLERLAGLGVTRYLEFGAGAVLCGLVERTLSGANAQPVTDPASVTAAVEGASA